jgi:hypothetical protein
MFVCPPRSCVARAIYSSVISGVFTSIYFILETSVRSKKFLMNCSYLPLKVSHMNASCQLLILYACIKSTVRYFL